MAQLGGWCNAALGFLGAGRGFREGNPPASSVPPLPSVLGKHQGLRNLMKRYSGMIISGYLPEIRHLLKKTSVSQPQTPADKSHGKKSKARQVFTFFEEYKGNPVWVGVKSNMQSGSHSGEIACLNSPALASQLCQLMNHRLFRAEQNADLRRTRAVYFWPAAAAQTPLYPYPEKWFGQLL